MIFSMHTKYYNIYSSIQYSTAPPFKFASYTHDVNTIVLTFDRTHSTRNVTFISGYKI